MRVHRVAVFVLFTLTASHVLAQAPAKPPAATKPTTPAAPPPPHSGQPINVKIDLTISEDGAPGVPLKKTVTAVVGDGYNGYVREQAVAQNQPGPGPFDRSVSPLNLDAMPTILQNGKIRLVCTIQYSSIQRPQSERPQTERQINTDIRQNLTLILDNGKPLVISQATDPITDRRVTVEVTATILK
jgi:hypothetical protein